VTVRKVLALAGTERLFIGITIVVGLASSVFEAVGLSLLIPLASVATGASDDIAIPVVDTVLRAFGGGVALGPVGIMAISILFFLCGVALTFANSVISNNFAMRFAHHLRLKVFETSLQKPVTQVENLPAGKFINLLVSETWRVCDVLFVLIYIAVEAVAACVLFAFLVMIAPFYAGVLVVLTAVMAVTVNAATRRIKALGQEAIAANEAFTAYMWDAVSGLRVIRGFGQEAHERARFARKSDEISRVFIRLGVLSSIVGPMSRTMTLVIGGTIVALTLMRGDPLPALVGFLAIAYRLQPRVSGLLGAHTKLKSLSASVSEVDAAVSSKPARAQRAAPFEGLRNEVSFVGVCARYPNSGGPVLHDVTFAIERGKVTAIAGYSGAGKSTIVALLLRFMEPEAGDILVDGTPLGQIPAERWHRRIAFVEQNAFLFNASVRENIGYGDLGAGIDRIEAAARTAHAHEFISMLKHGYDTVIGEHGVRLSQGQPQRIALARSLLREPDILILVEATNAVDRPTELALRDAIQKGRDRRAVVVIAHRRETIESADHVVVVDNGRIVETGTPAELGAAGGVFARLYLAEDRISGQRGRCGSVR